MKTKIAIVLLLPALFLIGCSEEMKGIETDQDTDMLVFSFDEDDFRKVYEENTGKAIPVSFEMNYSSMGIKNATAEQVEAFLKTSYDLLGDDVIQKMYNSFREDREELSPGGREGWRKVETGENLFLDYGVHENGKYMSTVYLEVDNETD